MVFDLRAVVGLVVFYDGKGVVTRRLQVCQLVAADLLQLRDVLCLLLILLLILFSHKMLLLLSARLTSVPALFHFLA